MQVAVHYTKKAPKLRPAKGCMHEGADALVLNSRIVKSGRRNQITCDANLCMACGTIRPIDAEFNHYHHALGHFWAAYGWNREIGMKLVELADISTGSKFESFLALRSGMSPAECAQHQATS